MSTAGANLSRPVGHPPLRGEGLGDQRGEWAPMDSPLLVGEGLGVRSASGDDRIKV